MVLGMIVLWLYFHEITKTKNKHLLSTYCVLGIVRSTSYELSHGVFIALLGRKHPYHNYFAEKKARLEKVCGLLPLQ